MSEDKMKGANGGDVMFITGRKYGDGHDGDFVFLWPGPEDGKEIEVLRLRSDGAFLVRGKVVANDAILYVAFREWLKGSRKSKAQDGEPDR